MSWAAAPLAIGGGLLQGFAAIQEGNAAKAAADARQQELERSSELERINATEQQASRLVDLRRTLGNIRGLTAQRNVDPNSPSVAAIEDSVTNEAYRDTQRLGFNANQSASNYRLAGQAAAMSGKAAQTAGYLRGAGSFLKAVGTTNSKFG